MTTKLTLKLSKRTIERAKRYASKNKQSLSLLVENYFNILSDKNAVPEIELSPNVIELSGIIKLGNDIDIKKEYGKHLVEKYL